MKNLGERGTPLLRRVLPERVFGDRRRVLAGAGLGVVAASLAAHGFFFQHTMTWSSHVVGPRARRVAELRRRTPRTGSLCASPCLASHFTDQEELFVTPFGTTTADWVVLDLQERFSGFEEMARHCDRTLRSGRYTPVFAEDGFVLFERDGGREGAAASFRLDALPTMQHQLDRPCGGFATLLGYDERKTHDGLELTLYWRCERRTGADCAALLVLATQEGQIGLRHLPAGGVLPTWRWRPGDLIADPVRVRGIRPAGGAAASLCEAELQPLSRDGSAGP
jgi:hypothetical protein